MGICPPRWGESLGSAFGDVEIFSKIIKIELKIILQILAIRSLRVKGDYL